jgi:hypothetical protein
MRFFALALLLVIPVEARGDCISQDAANAKWGAADKKNQASYQAALAKKKLAPIALKERTWPENAKPPAGLIEVSQREVNCKHDAIEFVEDAQHKIYKVARRPHVVNTTAIAVCTCAVPSFRCGGADLGLQGFGYELPAGATYGGEIAITYDSDSLQIKNKTAGCPPIAGPP